MQNLYRKYSTAGKTKQLIDVHCVRVIGWRMRRNTAWTCGTATLIHQHIACFCLQRVMTDMRSINRSKQPIEKKLPVPSVGQKNIPYKVNRNLIRKTDIDTQLMGCDTQLAFGENVQRNCPVQCSRICLWEIFLRVVWVQNIWENILGVMSSRNVWRLGQFWEIFTGRKWPGW